MRPFEYAVKEKELGFWNRNDDYVVEPGEFKVWIVDNVQPDPVLPGKSVSYVRK